MPTKSIAESIVITALSPAFVYKAASFRQESVPLIRMHDQACTSPSSHQDIAPQPRSAISLSQTPRQNSAACQNSEVDQAPQFSRAGAMGDGTSSTPAPIIHNHCLCPEARLFDYAPRFIMANSQSA